MARVVDLQLGIRNVLIRSPLQVPTFACPYCPRRLKTRGGCNRHIDSKHPNAEPHAADPATDFSRTSSSPQPAFHGMIPVPSDLASPLPSLNISNAEPGTYSDIGDQYNQGSDEVHESSPPRDQYDQGSMPSDRGEELESHQSFSPRLGGDLDVRGRSPDAPCTMRAYHPKLDGESDFSLINIDIILPICRADLQREW